jgi:ATP-binding protein involved in chromosome partitioning
MTFWKSKNENAPAPDAVMAQARRGPAQRRSGPEALAKVGNVIAIGSGKGGVGKSTVTANLAMALVKRGARVGILDADIYGPSQPRLLGAPAVPPPTEEGNISPVVCHGIPMMSIGFIVPEGSPVIWRAPMALKAIYQFLGNVEWGELDYLLIDMPPGTGDVQLTLAQQAPLTGSVVVSTPQDVALGVARKGLRMFEQVKVPILGIVENMSGFACEKCGHEHRLFKKEGARALATETHTPFLGEIPLETAVMEGGDAGQPILLRDASSPAAKAFMAVAEKFEVAVARHNAAPGGEEPSQIKVGPEGELQITWPDGHAGVHPAWSLRTQCPCALCVDEDTGKRVLDPQRIPLDVKITGVQPVGHYGAGLAFSDGHNTGIYTYTDLRSTCECPPCRARRGVPAETFSV